jgi:hypothetical protein
MITDNTDSVIVEDREISTTLGERLEELRLLNCKLAMLLDKPEPGVSGWWMFLASVQERIKNWSPK